MQPDSRVRLSIGIPTFNRAEKLQQLLQSLQIALARLAPEQAQQIEILVADNASTDHTQSVIANFLRVWPTLRAWRNRCNRGAEGNIEGLLSSAAGDFIWIVGDDDRLRPPALHAILGHLSPEVGALLLNYATWDATFSVLLRPNARGLRRDEFALAPDRLLRKHGIYAGYISAVIVNRRILVYSKEKFDELAPFGFAFMYLVYSGLMQSGMTAGFIAAIHCDNRQDDNIGYDWYLYFFEGTSRALEMLRAEGYSWLSVWQSRQWLVRRFWLPRVGLDGRRGVLPRGRVLRLGWRYGKDLPWVWMALLPALLVPVGCLDWGVRFWKRLANATASRVG